MHLETESARASGLALALTTGALAKTGQILLAHSHIAQRVAGACVIDENLQAHLGALPRRRPRRWPESGVDLNGRSGAERRHPETLFRKRKGSTVECLKQSAITSSVVFLGLLIHPRTVFIGIALGRRSQQRSLAGKRKV